MNEWLVCATVLVGAMIGPLVACARGTVLDALVALETAGMVATVVMMLLAEGYHRQSFMDLAVVTAVMSFIGALGFVRLVGRRL
jgi:multisubunit Na+/H+ antiporter MnhF subunit